jgi:hypothetical protein
MIKFAFLVVMSGIRLPRRMLMKSIGAISASGAITQSVSAKRDRYPIVTDRGVYEEVPISVFAAGAQKHPTQDRVAVVTAAFGDGIQLYIADGATDLSDVPDTLYQITSDATTGVYNVSWAGNNTLKYVIDYTKYTRKIPPSYVRLDHKTTEEDILSTEGEN